MIVERLNPYALAMRVRRMLYEHGVLKSYAVEIPVISIGNVSMGGTGKSPMTIYLAEFLSQLGKRVAIVSRGYKRISKGYKLVRDGSEILAKVAETGDEVQMIARKLPKAIVIVDEDRVHGAEQARNLGADVVLLDDGFQHLRLKRDLDIVLFNSDLGRDAVLPFGRLREPLSSLQSANVVISTDSSAKLPVRSFEPFLRAAFRTGPLSLKQMPERQSADLSELRGKKVLALSSIANPERFARMLSDLGADVEPNAFWDHAEYTEPRVRKAIARAKVLDCRFIVTTEKDIVKLERFAPLFTRDLPLLVLAIGIQFTSGEEALKKKIEALFA